MSLFREVGMHAGLGRTVAQIGTERFWKQLVLLLHQCLPFDNALAIFYPARWPAQALEEYDAQPSSKPASMLVYLNGLYLLDPFFQACREGYASGVYRLEEVAPDHFRQSEALPQLLPRQRAGGRGAIHPATAGCGHLVVVPGDAAAFTA